MNTDKNKTSSGSLKDKNQNEENEIDKTIETKKPSKLLGFILKHKMVFTLLSILVPIMRLNVKNGVLVVEVIK